MLDKKTRCEGDKTIGLDLKYILLFLFCNVFCFLFINKIKEKRKIEHYKNLIDYYKVLNDYHENSIYYGMKNDTELTTKILKMKRYLKLKNINYGK